MQILIVEDDVNLREMLKSLLELEHYEVEATASASDAHELIELHHPDIALIDIGLPGKNGIELVKRLRINRDNNDCYLIAMTGYAEPQLRLRALELGFDEYLIKPVNVSGLLRLIATRYEASSQPTRPCNADPLQVRGAI